MLSTYNVVVDFEILINMLEEKYKNNDECKIERYKDDITEITEIEIKNYKISKTLIEDEENLFKVYYIYNLDKSVKYEYQEKLEKIFDDIYSSMGTIYRKTNKNQKQQDIKKETFKRVLTAVRKEII